MKNGLVLLENNMSNLQVVSPTKRWSISLGNHGNIIIRCNRFPLDLSLDLANFTAYDFTKLGDFFEQIALLKKEEPTYGHLHRSEVVNNKWSFNFHLGTVMIIYSNAPFSGTIILGEVSKSECLLLSKLFNKASEM